MPEYAYTCKGCGKDFTIFLSIKDYELNPEIKCPQCKSSDVTKKLTSFFAKTSKKS